MELLATVTSYSGMGQAQEIRESVRTETAREQAAAPPGDNVTISQEGREKLRMEKLGEAESRDARDEQKGQGAQNGPTDGSSLAAGGTSGGESAGASEMKERIEMLKKQIQQTQKRMKEAQQKLQEAVTEQQSQASPESGQADESPEVKAARLEIQALSGQLTQLNEQLRKAMEEMYGGSGGGVGGGTRAGGGFALEGHIGSGTDPHAAA